MSTTISKQNAPAQSAGGRSDTPRGSSDVRLTVARVANAEWIKFRTLRSSWFMLAAAAIGMVGIAVIIGFKTGSSSNWSTLAPEDSAPTAVLAGYHLVTLLIAVLGVLFMTGEYGTGMIRATLAAVPRRVPVLLAKTAVLTAVSALTMIPIAFAAFFSGQAMLAHYGHSSSLTGPGVLRIVIGTGVYLTLLALLGLAIGAIVRNTAGGVSTSLGVLFVLPLVIGFLPATLSSHITPYLPSNAGEAFISTAPSPDLLAPWNGLAVLAIWVVAALCIAAVQLRRRDA